MMKYCDEQLNSHKSKTKICFTLCSDKRDKIIILDKRDTKPKVLLRGAVFICYKTKFELLFKKILETQKNCKAF